MSYHNNTERPMTIMAWLSSTPLREIAHIRGGLAWRKDRNFNFRLRPDGLDAGYSTRTTFDLKLGLDGAPPIDLTGHISPEIAQRIAGSAGRDADRFGLIELECADVERLAEAIAQVRPRITDPVMPVLEACWPNNGLLVPIATVRKHLTHHDAQTEKGHVMSHPLRRSAPAAFDLIKQAADDAENVIAEVILFEVARDQGWCKRIDHIKGNKPPRAKSLTEAEIDAVAKAYAAEITRRKVSEMDEPLVNPLPDGTIGIIPLLGQSDEANVVLLACFIAPGSPGSMRLALEIDEVLPTISRAVLQGLGRKPKHEASE